MQLQSKRYITYRLKCLCLTSTSFDLSWTCNARQTCYSQTGCAVAMKPHTQPHSGFGGASQVEHQSLHELKKNRTESDVSLCCRLEAEPPLFHNNVIKWKHFLRYWPFVRGIRSPMNSPHKGQWREALMFSLICTWINEWVNNREAGDWRCHRAHYDVTVMWRGTASILRRMGAADWAQETRISIMLTSCAELSR